MHITVLVYKKYQRIWYSAKIHTFPSTSENIGGVINRGHASHVVSGDRQVVGVERVLLGLHGYFVHGVIALAVNTR